MAGLLIFLLFRHREHSLWRFVTQIAWEACWFRKHGCAEGGALASSLRKFSLPILPLWAGDPRLSTQEKPFSCNSWAQIWCVDKVPAETSFGLSELAESFLGLSDHVLLVLLYFLNQPQLRRPELQQESHFHQTKGSAVHSVIHFSSSFPRSGLTWSKTGILCQILLKAGPSSHTPGHWGVWLSRCWGRETWEPRALDICGEFPFSFYTFKPHLQIIVFILLRKEP